MKSRLDDDDKKNIQVGIKAKNQHIFYQKWSSDQDIILNFKYFHNKAKG